MKGKFITARSKEGDYFFKLVSEDEKVLAVSELFETLSACKRGIEGVKNNIAAAVAEGPDAVNIGKAIYEITRSGNGYVFLLKGSFGEVLVESEEFDSRDECLDHVKELKALEIVE